jgi:hypothetical protein
MAELKTKRTEASVDAFLESIPDGRKRADATKLAALMKQVTKADPKMWGPAIIGFGSRRLKYPTGREIDWFSIGFSPRKQNLALYLGTGGDGFAGRDALLEKLGKHKTGKGCVYINALEDVDASVLKKLLAAAAGRAKRN